VSREHPCAIDSHRIREQDWHISLYPTSFSGWRTKSFPMRMGPNPRKILNTRHGPFAVPAVGNCIVASCQNEESL
jgi:hypothetical protein